MYLAKIPCKECLLIPLCRHKPYLKLFEQCDLIAKIIDSHDIVGRKRCKPVFKLQEILKPTKWIFRRDKDNYLPWIYEV